MNPLEEFLDRELELKQTLSRGEWLRHIVQSHDELLELVEPWAVMVDQLQAEVEQLRQQAAEWAEQQRARTTCTRCNGTSELDHWTGVGPNFHSCPACYLESPGEGDS